MSETKPFATYHSTSTSEYRMMKSLLLALFVTASIPAAHAAATLCEGDEQVLFSCPVAKTTKIVSVCGSKLLTATSGYLQYRFGRVGAVEMTFPATRVRTQAQFGWNTNYHRDVTDSWLSFTNAKYAYGVFQLKTTMSAAIPMAMPSPGIATVSPSVHPMSAVDIRWNARCRRSGDLSR